MTMNDLSRATVDFFQQNLLDWFEKNPRPLPWKDTKDPYLIWLSEIILQQTRVEQGLPYFEKFRQRFPTVSDLAKAPEDEVMKLWEGLGYYSRARNLHAAAKFITDDLKGHFPADFDGIRKLKGVGDYTAAAVASFAFDLPHAVVDGNVYRVLSRFLAIEIPIDETAGKKIFANAARRLLDESHPAVYNQAIMNFGAMHCLPANPKCTSCPLQELCVAFRQKTTDKLPVKAKKLEKKDRFFHYLVVNCGEAVLIRRRNRRDIWQHLYEFPMVEAPKSATLLEDLALPPFLQNHPFQLKKISKTYRQLLTHQTVFATFFEIDLPSNPVLQNEEFILVKRENLPTFAFPKIIDLYLKDKILLLELF